MLAVYHCVMLLPESLDDATSELKPKEVESARTVKHILYAIVAAVLVFAIISTGFIFVPLLRLALQI